MPLSDEIIKLWNNTDWDISTRNGIKGILFAGKDGYAGKSIFIPFIGYAEYSSLKAAVLNAPTKWVEDTAPYRTFLSWCLDGAAFVRTFVNKYEFQDPEYYTLLKIESHINTNLLRLYWGMQIRPVISADE